MASSAQDGVAEHPSLFLSCLAACRWPCCTCCCRGTQEFEVPLLEESAPQPVQMAGTQNTWDVQSINAAWKAQWAQAEATYAKFAEERSKAKQLQRNEKIEIADEHFAALREGPWFLMVNQHMHKVNATMLDGTGAPLNPKAHLRTIDFSLLGEAELSIIDAQADLSSVLPEDNLNGRAFVRALFRVPQSSLPPWGQSRHVASHPDGHRLAPCLPIDSIAYWHKKALGFRKYGPTFLQFLESFRLSPHCSDKARVHLDDDNYVIMPLSDKTRPIQGGEKVVVRGPLRLENMQRQTLTFPVLSAEGTLMYEAVEGYLENIAWLGEHLQMTLLLPYEDDVTEHSYPFGPSHPAPDEFYHHHKSYSRMFHVEPMTGRRMIRLTGALGKVTLPAGTNVEHTLTGVAEAAAGAAIVGGLAEGATIGEAAAVAGEAAAAAGEAGEAATAVGEAGGGAEAAAAPEGAGEADATGETGDAGDADDADEEADSTGAAGDAGDPEGDFEEVKGKKDRYARQAGRAARGEPELTAEDGEVKAIVKELKNAEDHSTVNVPKHLLERVKNAMKTEGWRGRNDFFPSNTGGGNLNMRLESGTGEGTPFVHLQLQTR